MAGEGCQSLPERLHERFGARGDALYSFVCCLLALTSSGLVAFLFFEEPLAPRSSPRNTI